MHTTDENKKRRRAGGKHTRQHTRKGEGPASYLLYPELLAPLSVIERHFASDVPRGRDKYLLEDPLPPPFIPLSWLSSWWRELVPAPLFSFSDRRGGRFCVYDCNERRVSHHAKPIKGAPGPGPASHIP